MACWPRVRYHRALGERPAGERVKNQLCQRPGDGVAAGLVGCEAEESAAPRLLAARRRLRRDTGRDREPDAAEPVVDAAPWPSVPPSFKVEGPGRFTPGMAETPTDVPLDLAPTISTRACASATARPSPALRRRAVLWPNRGRHSRQGRRPTPSRPWRATAYRCAPTVSR